jgi:hypothetical protein
MKRRNPGPFAKKSNDKIWVNSKAYGSHLRAARGTRSHAEVNDAMKAHGLRMIGSNSPAKLICDALKPYRVNFPGGMIWQKLVKHFAAQAKKGVDYNVSGIVYWDLNDAEPTSRIMAPTIRITPGNSPEELLVSVSYFFSDRFLQRSNHIKGFVITIIFLFPDFIRNEIITIPISLPEKAMADHLAYAFILPIPAGVNIWLACFKAEPSYKTGPSNDKTGVNKAMCLVSSEILEEATLKEDQQGEK